MSPLNLNDVEEYLVEQAKHCTVCYDKSALENWLRQRFAELRAREASVLQNPGD